MPAYSREGRETRFHCAQGPIATIDDARKQYLREEKKGERGSRPPGRAYIYRGPALERAIPAMQKTLALAVKV